MSVTLCVWVISLWRNLSDTVFALKSSSAHTLNPSFPEAVIMQKYCTLWLLLARNKTHNWFISSTAAFIQCLSVRTQTNGILFSYRCWPDCLVPCWLWISLDILHSPSSSLWPTFFLFFLLWWSHLPPVCSVFCFFFFAFLNSFWYLFHLKRENYRQSQEVQFNCTAAADAEGKTRRCGDEVVQTEIDGDRRRGRGQPLLFMK